MYSCHALFTKPFVPFLVHPHIGSNTSQNGEKEKSLLQQAISNSGIDSRWVQRDCSRFRERGSHRDRCGSSRNRWCIFRFGGTISEFSFAIERFCITTEASASPCERRATSKYFIVPREYLLLGPVALHSL